MKKQRLVKHLSAHGCYFYREGSDHEYWRSADGMHGSALPPHREIKPGTVRAICRELGIPVPSEK